MDGKETMLKSGDSQHVDLSTQSPLSDVLQVSGECPKDDHGISSASSRDNASGNEERDEPENCEESKGFPNRGSLALGKDGKGEMSKQTVQQACRPHKLLVDSALLPEDRCSSDKSSKGDACRFECDICKMSFSNVSNYEKHLAAHAQETGDVTDVERPNVCPECSKAFQTKAHLEKHLLSHSAGPVSRKEEGFSDHLVSVELLTSHPSTGFSVSNAEVQCGKHNKTSHECHVCGKVYVYKACLKEHMIKHLGEKRVRCKICKEGFGHKRQLKKHVKTQHCSEFDSHGKRKKKSHTCTCKDCGGVMSKSECPRRSKATYSSDKKGDMEAKVKDVKPAHYDSSNKLGTIGESSQIDYKEDHVKDNPQSKNLHKRHQSTKIYWTKADLTCKQCGKQYDTRRKWREHQKCHATEKPFLCSICGKSFLFNAFYKNHLLSHSDEKPFRCSHCGQCFKQKFNLKHHINMRHIAMQSFLCHLCGNSYISNNSLQIHLQIHSGERPHQCEHCPKAFYQKSNLREHLRSHTGERPYKCDTCNLDFRSSGALRQHRRKHTGEKPYGCSVCGRSFARSGTLRDHKRTHTGEKPHQCDVCRKHFSQKAGLNTHKKIHLKEISKVSSASHVLC